MDARIFAPHPLLADLIHSLLVTTLPGGRYVLPASLQPILLTVLRGAILVDGRDGRPPDAAAALSLSGGTSGPRSATSEPGTEILMVAVRAGRLRRLLGLPAAEVAEELVPLDAMLPPTEVDQLAERLAESASVAERIDAFQDFLIAQRRRLVGAPADLVLPAGWIEQPVGALADRFGIGTRQFERRFAASYGQSLRAYRNQLRCSRMVTRLLDPHPAGDWAGIAAESGYFDQAQLCRDVRRFTGYAPSELARGIGSDDSAMWPYRFSSAQIGRIFGESGF